MLDKPDELVIPSCRYVFQNRHQDSGWQNTTSVGPCDSLELAKTIAVALSKKMMVYGMVRIVDTHTSQPIGTFSAGLEIE